MYIGQLRQPHTSDLPGVYMELDFGRDVSISEIVIWNDDRAFCCQRRIIGTNLSVKNDAGVVVYSQNITIDPLELHFTFGVSIAPTTMIPPTINPTGPTVRPSQKPTRFDRSRLIYGRYIRLSRVAVSPDAGRYTFGYVINILGIDVYDQYGSFISDQSNPSMNGIWDDDEEWYGPQHLIDGFHKPFYDSPEWPRIPSTTDVPGAYMELDFGRDESISETVIWNENRAFCCQIRIIGTNLSVKKDAGVLVYPYSQNITRDPLELHFKFGESISSPSLDARLTQLTRTRSSSPSRSMKPTLSNGSHLLFGRYVTLERINTSPDKSHVINILGLDIYDNNGVFIPNKSSPVMSSIWNNDTDQHGPQYLIDGVHQQYDTNGNLRLPQTMNASDAYMQLDFGEDIPISSLVIWNRQDCCSDRIIGTKVSIVNNAGSKVFGQVISTEQEVYYFHFGYQHPTIFRTSKGPIRSMLGKCI